MKHQYTIGELGKLVNLPPKTIRYYEEIKLITPTKRGENGYRLYTETSVEELSLIKYARDLGLPIATIKRLMIGCINGNCVHAKEDVEQEIDAYLLLLKEKIHDLVLLNRKLKQLRNNLNIPDSCNDTTYCCNILSQISMMKGGE